MVCQLLVESAVCLDIADLTDESHWTIYYYYMGHSLPVIIATCLGVCVWWRFIKQLTQPESSCSFILFPP